MNIGESVLLTAVTASLSGGIMNLIPRKTILFKRLISLAMFISLCCITFDTLLLIYYQLQHNYSYSYVYQHTSSALPSLYLVSALWSGQEGSFLLWSAFGSIIGFILWMEFRELDVKNRVAFSIYTFINSGLIFMTLLSKPFKQLGYLPSDGMGLNAALQNPWMVVHPPLVFIGYSSMAVIFALALSAGGRNLQNHQRLFMKKWTLVSWLFLSAGILSGSLWAYVALGWGGYWAWDPIENAALVPWLLLGALVHNREDSKELRASYKVKYMLPFVLAAFGTYLARSGLLQDISVHAYAESSFRLPLMAMLFILVAAVLIQVFSKSKVKALESRDRRFNALRFFRLSSYVFAFMVLAGTLMPVFTQKELNTSFFNYSALLFSIVCAILFIKEVLTAAPQIAFKSIIASTLALMFIVILMGFSNFTWLTVLLLYLFPLTAWIINSLNLKSVFLIKRPRNPSAAIAHTGLILLMFGTITSLALSSQGGFIYERNDNYIHVNNSKIELSDLTGQKNFIVHNGASDIILYPPDINTLSGDPTVPGMVAYETRPLISIFWMGGALILLGTFGALVRKANFHYKNNGDG